MTVIVLVVIIVLGAGHYYLGVMDGQFRSFQMTMYRLYIMGYKKGSYTYQPEGDTYFTIIGGI